MSGITGMQFMYILSFNAYNLSGTIFIPVYPQTKIWTQNTTKSITFKFKNSSLS